MAMSKKQREEQSFWAWVDQNKEGLMLIVEARAKGFDTNAILRDALKGQVKDREHYQIRKAPETETLSGEDG